MKIALAADHGGYKLKEKIKVFLKNKGYQVIDFGTFSEESCDYPVYASAAAQAVSKAKVSRATLVCKSGIGNSMVANKFPGVRAALCLNVAMAKLSRQHNDANVLVLGAKFVKLDLAKKMVAVWLKEPFLAGRHLRRVNQIKKIEKLTMKGKR